MEFIVQYRVGNDIVTALSSNIPMPTPRVGDEMTFEGKEYIDYQWVTYRVSRVYIVLGKKTYTTRVELEAALIPYDY